MVLVVGLEVGGERLDFLGEDGDLDFARTRVVGVALELALDGGLVDFHVVILSFRTANREAQRPGPPETECRLEYIIS